MLTLILALILPFFFFFLVIVFFFSRKFKRKSKFVNTLLSIKTLLVIVVLSLMIFRFASIELNKPPNFLAEAIITVEKKEHISYRFATYVRYYIYSENDDCYIAPYFLYSGIDEGKTYKIIYKSNSKDIERVFALNKDGDISHELSRIRPN